MVYSVPKVCHPATMLSRPRPILFWAGPTLTVMDKSPKSWVFVLLEVFWAGTCHGEVDLSFRADISRIKVQIHSN